MGFNLHNLGLIRRCRLVEGVLEIESPMTGEITRCKTTLTVTTEWQQNIFYSKTVAFLLYCGDYMYIGRYDGKVSIYKMPSTLLTGLQNWEPPKHPPTSCCGYYCKGGASYDIYLDLSDLRTLYCGFHNMEAALVKSAENVTFDLSYAAAMAEKRDGAIEWYIFKEGGVPCATERRSVQDALWKRDCTVFL